jgi:DNA-binding NtrC family response regulator
VRSLFEAAAKIGSHIDLAKNKQEAVKFLEQENYSIIFVNEQVRDENNPDFNAADFLKLIKTRFPALPVVLTTEKRNKHQENIDLAISGLQMGFSDVLVKPLTLKRAEEMLYNLTGKKTGKNKTNKTEDKSFEKIVGNSAQIKQVIELSRQVAPTSATVLISGESGTGKELISKLIHRLSKRADKPFVQVNCAALSDTLLESELFGHERGAFTGAYDRRKGRFELADGGTLLLDEITETPSHFQAKLLRVLEQQQFERVGGNESINVNVRIISTTNKDLSTQVKEGNFREDLYYRLSGVRLVLPPLRKHPEDIEQLVWYFVELYAQETNRQIEKLDPEMLEIFENYSWPGNVRQLRNLVLTSLILGKGSVLELADVSWIMEELGLSAQEENSSNEPADSDLGGIPLDRLERQAIMDTLKKTDGNRTKAAKSLGISDRTLRGKIRQYKQQEAASAV